MNHIRLATVCLSSIETQYDDVKNAMEILNKDISKKEYDDLSGMTEARKSFGYWYDSAIKYIALVPRSKDFMDKYRSITYETYLKSSDDVVMVPFGDTAQAMMKACTHIAWYKLFEHEFGKKPRFLQGELFTTDLHQQLSVAFGLDLPDHEIDSMKIAEKQQEILDSIALEHGIDLKKKMKDNEKQLKSVIEERGINPTTETENSN